jgi:TonB family protein
VRRPESHITQVIPRPLEQVVSRALSEQPEARWQSAAELSRALQRWSAAQPGRSDNRALAVFMIALFDSAIADDDKRLRALLARVPPARPQVSGAPLAAPPAVDARHSYARLVRASARPAPSAPTPNWTDASEHTPARGMLMQKLAAEMIVAPAAERPRPTPVTAAAESAKASPSAPAERAPEMPFPDLGAETWDEDSPTHGWVPASELPATRSRPPSHAIMPPAPAVKPAPVIAKAPPLPSRTAPTRSAPAPYSRPPLPLAPPPPALRASARPRPQPRWVVPAIAAAALGVVVAATALLRSGDGALSTIHVHTRPAGAEVYLRGQPIGFTPLQLGELPSGAATVELRAPAYEPATRAIQLEPGKVVLLDVDLIRRAAPAAVPTTPAAQQADLQAQLAAAREVEQRAEPAQSNQAADRDDRRRYHARRASSAAVAAEPEAAPEAAPSPPVKGDVRLDPRSEWKPAPLPGGTAPALRGSASSASATPTAVAPQPSAPPAPRAAASASSGVSRPASLIAQTTPRFPARAKRMGITTGAVTIEYTIDVSGAVKNASVVKADPPGLFDDTSLREIQKWKYRPKLENGTPVETRQRFTFRFSD